MTRAALRERLLPPLQALVFVPFWAAGTYLARRFHVPLPGGIVGLALLLAALALRVVRLEWVEQGATWLFRHMLLFFIPAAVGIVQYPQLLGATGARALGVVAVSTAAVMIATGAAVEALCRRREARR